MHIYNSKKVKKQINIDLNNRIDGHRKDYCIQFKNYSEKFDVKDKHKIIYNSKIQYNKFINYKFEDMIFKNCIFTGTSFSKCIFQNVIFEDCDFFYENKFVIFEDDCIFNQSTFKKCNIKKNVFKGGVFNKIKFVKCNMKDLIFTEIQINNIKIMDSDCRSFKILDSSIEKFVIEDEYITKFDEDTFIDEIILDKKYIKSYDNASKVYRIISTKFENNNLFDHAAEYYYLSKKTERKVLRGIDKIKSYIFWMICGYGERPTYALITSVEIVLLFAILYMFTGLSIDGDIINYENFLFLGLIYTPDLYSDFFNSLYFSITTFTTVGYGDITPTGLSIFLSGIEMFLGVTMVGLWTATLARKIIR